MNVEDEIVLLKERMTKLTADVEAIQQQLRAQKDTAKAGAQPLEGLPDQGEGATNPEGNP